MSGGIQGSGGSAVAPRGKRIAVGIVDLLIIPILLGIVAGMVLLAVDEGMRNVFLVIINIAWMLFRDAVFSPGRKMIGLGLKSLAGGKVTWLQAVKRNVFVVVPIVLVPGYFCEMARVLITTAPGKDAASTLMWRRVVYAAVGVLSLIIGVPAAMAAGNPLVIILSFATLGVPVFFFLKDKAGLSEGDRLMDVVAGTRVTEAA